MLVTVTASPTGRPSKPHDFSIPNEAAIPAAPPPGATTETAVDASVTRLEWKYDSPGSAAIHGGPNVATLISAATASPTIHAHERPFTNSQTSW